MPIVDDFGNSLNEKGKALHWKSFERFEGKDLHTLFVSEIKKVVKKRKTINSSILGAEIIERLRKEKPIAFEGFFRKKLIGRLFGMTLWNELAKQDETEWNCRKLGKGDKGGQGYLYKRVIKDYFA